MNWINIIMISLVSSAITGGIITILWIWVCHVSGSIGNARYLYLLLRGAVFGYVLPLLFMLSYNIYWLHRGYAYSLVLTEKTLQITICIVGIIWFLGVMVQLGRQNHYWKMFKQIKASCVPAPKEYNNLLKKVCEELHINKPIRLVVGYGVISPFIYGAFKPCIFLPDKDFTEEDLEIILYHEVVHYKQNDVFWKPIFGLIYFLYWFSPLAKRQWNLTKRWAEASNDARCCEEKVTKKKYFSLLLEMSSSVEYRDSLGFVSLWQEEKNELKWRVSCIGRMKSRVVTVRTSVVLVLVMLVIGCGLTAGDVYLLDTLYGKTYWLAADTEYAASGEEANFKKREKTIINYVIQGDEFIEQQKLLEGKKKTFKFEWQIPSGKTYASNEFILKSNEKVTIMLAGYVQNTKIVTGIVNPKGEAQYIEKNSVMAYTFNSPKKDRYRVFVTNSDKQKISLTGYYIK